MIEFFVTINPLTEDGDTRFQSEVTRNSMVIKNAHPDGSLIHYTIQGDWNGYQHLSMQRDKDDSYKIISIEHFEEI
jgi:hypothetical protein